MIVFRLDRRSGVPAYRQLVDQVRHAVSLGLLQPGDQLPAVREVVKQITINPNTVHRAYRELELLGLTEGRVGSGTFLKASPVQSPAQQSKLLSRLERWIRDAQEAGLGAEAIEALVDKASQQMKEEGKL
jgi:GntR family transcriptional regulator